MPQTLSTPLKNKMCINIYFADQIIKKVPNFLKALNLLFDFGGMARRGYMFDGKFLSLVFPE